MVKVSECCPYIFPKEYVFCPYHGKKLKDITEEKFRKMMFEDFKSGKWLNNLEEGN